MKSSRALLRTAPAALHKRIATGTPLRVAAFALPKPVQEEGPGSGKRHYPTGQQRFDLRRGSDAEHHDMMSTQECYNLFPLVTHASTPLRIEDREPAGLSAQRVGDAGPSTGHRRRPAPADSPASAQPPLLPYPEARSVDLRQELLVRHAPEVLLGQQRGLEA